MRIRLNYPIKLSQIQKITSAFLADTDRDVTHIVTDSREAEAGDLFIAIRGEQFNGSDFAEDAMKKGAYVLSERSDFATLTVSSSIDALLKIGVFAKSKLKNLKYTIAITGSVGKTTTKNLTTLLLKENFKVHSTEENQNNEIGLAYTLLRAPIDTDILVCELGMNHVGEISRLSQCINPDISIITNIGNAHIGNLGSREMIALAKLEICDGMSNGITIVPYEEPLLKNAKGRLSVSLYDKDADATLFPVLESSSESQFKFCGRSLPALEGKIKAPGKHILSSLSFAITVAFIIGLSSDDIVSALKKFDASLLRGSFLRIGKYSIYDDSYSSSPEAVTAVLNMLSLYDEFKKSAVLGDMLELGSKTEYLHEKIGKEAFLHGINQLYAFGVYAPFIAKGALDAGMPRERIFINTDPLSPNVTAKQIANSYHGELILVKASHRLNIGRIYTFLREQDAGEE